MCKAGESKGFLRTISTNMTVWDNRLRAIASSGIREDFPEDVALVLEMLPSEGVRFKV